jgi:hypothetical protein
MNAKTNFEAVPSAMDRLRAAHAKRDELAAVSAEVQQKLDKLAPLEAAVAQARADLQQIEQADADALRAWIDQGGNGTAPTGNAPAREAAARKLASAEARLKSSRDVQSSLERQLLDANEGLRDFAPALRAAEIEVIGEEVLRAVEMMRQTSMAVLESEAHFLAAHRLLKQLRDTAGPSQYECPPVVARSFSNLLDRIVELNKLSEEERDTAAKTGLQRAQQVLNQLLAGEDPKK